MNMGRSAAAAGYVLSPAQPPSASSSANMIPSPMILPARGRYESPMDASANVNVNVNVNGRSRLRQRLQSQPSQSQSQLSQSAHLFSSSTAGGAGVNALKCPELLLRGVELERKLQALPVASSLPTSSTRLATLEKKGKRFESPWHEFSVAVYAGVLYFYEDVNDLPRGIVPLVGSVVKAVDRIFKNSDHLADMEASAEECGPCFKVTSSANRVMLFRCESDASRNAWIRMIQYASNPVNETAHTSLSLGTSISVSSSSSRASNEDIVPRLSGLERARSTPTNRLSLDDASSRRQSQSSRRSMTRDLEEAVAKEPEISQMLRDAMALVRKQKQEIQDLRKALEEEKQRSTSRQEAIEAPVVMEEVDTATKAATSADNETLFLEEPTPSPPPPPTAETALPSFQQQPAAASTDYLQKQAMELAEIARNLQLSFQNDVYSSTKQINSTNSSTPTEFLDHISTTSSNYSDQPSEADDDDEVRSEAGSERLSEFEVTDAKFLESNGILEPNGILDSIQKAMRDFMSPISEPRSSSEQIIINDDVIAEIRQGAPIRKRDEFSLMDQSTLRSLRSQSSGDEFADYKMVRSPKTLTRTRSAFEFTVDDFNSPAPNSRNRKRLPKDLGVLVIEDNMAVVSSILQTASREEKTSLLLPLVRLFNRHNRLSRLIKWAIESEVASVMNVATLFRSDDYASRLVSTFSKSVGGGFIKIILSDPISEIYKIKLNDVDLTPPLQEEDFDEEAAQRHADNLMDACQLILDSIIANKDKIPRSFFHICSHLNAKVINRFDGSLEGLALEDPASLTRSVIGGFLFLRFVCPAITTPHLHDLVDKEPVPETRKILVLITKLLFKTATSVLFNEKEAHLRILNPFIERNSPAIQGLFVDLSVAPAEGIDDCFAADSGNLFADISPDQPEVDLAVIRVIADKNFDEIEKKLSVSGCSPLTAENLRASLHASRGDDMLLSHKSQRSKKLNMKFLSSFSKIVRKQSDV